MPVIRPATRRPAGPRSEGGPGSEGEEAPAGRSGPRFAWRAVLVGVLLLALVVLIVVLLARGSGSGERSQPMESIFQDDDHLIYSPTATVAQTLDGLKELGVDRLRLTILWSAIAPRAKSHRRPRHFHGTDPASYPAAAWQPYDRVVLLARQRGIGVDFNVTAPGPLWAMGHGAPTAKIATHLRPDARLFGQFVAAVGRRYDGTYKVAVPGAPPVTLPRVDFWSVWNEPNQPGWLYPQWRRVAGQWVLNSPRLYRRYVDTAFAALAQTGHRPGRDTILIGELAPEGSESTGAKSQVPPLPFLRALYCLDSSYHPLTGTAAAALGCPGGGGGDAFVRAHPGLFDLSGFAHHPYSFFLPPGAHMSDPNFAPLSDLSRFEQALDRSLSAYGQDRTLPLYLTEYGYETNPPNPFRGVSLARQARYLDQAQYMASQDPRVRAMAQFLLLDAPPDTSYPPGTIRYWSTFQTGLLFVNGAPKPSLLSYRLPIYVAQPKVAPGGSLKVWAMLRAAPNGTSQSATVQWRPPDGRYRSLATVRTADPSGIFTTDVTLPGRGQVRVIWKPPRGHLVGSRVVDVGMG